jgi:hypothetical protein
MMKKRSAERKEAEGALAEKVGRDVGLLVL